MLGPCLQEILYTTLTVGFPTFSGRCSHKPGSFERVTLCTGIGSAAKGLAAQNSPLVLPVLSKSQCFTFNYAQQKWLKQVCHCCLIHNDLQNRSEPEQLFHKLGVNVQMKTRKQAKRSTLLCFVPLYKRGLRRDVCSSFPQESKVASCFPCGQNSLGEAHFAIK